MIDQTMAKKNIRNDIQQREYSIRPENDLEVDTKKPLTKGRHDDDDDDELELP